MKEEGIIMNESVFRNFYLKNHLNDQIEGALSFLKQIERDLFVLDNISKSQVDELGQYLIDENLNHVQNFIIIMRYFKASKDENTYIYLTQFTGGMGVFETILKRLKAIDMDVYQLITSQMKMPVLGLSPKALTNYTHQLMTYLNTYLDPDQERKVLTGNNHQIPESTQIKEKIAYESADSLKTYLKERHQRKIKELESFMATNDIWFEQKITQEVIDYVESNQEILSGRLEGDHLYITKIPYDTVNFLNAYDLKDKQYYACHCPFARESIYQDRKVDQGFCYCSAGFAKFPFEVILGQSLDIKVIASAIGQDDHCRFVIDLSGIDYKK
jgi:hypothetical protein